MRKQLVLLACTAAASLAASTIARADTTVVQPAPVRYQPVAEAPHGYTGPNRALLVTGLATFGLSYIPAVTVAATSSLDADHHLYVPIAGPWLDLANRPPCEARYTSCDTENVNKVLIGVDGVFQAIGVIAIFTSFLAPEHERTVVTASERPRTPTKVYVTPAHLGPGGYGLAAVGSF
jgi:hypothetical protein